MNANPADAPAALIVDDDDYLIVGAMRMFRRAPFRVLSAPTAAAALEILASQSIQVVVSDQRMPGMPGVDFLATVRERWPATMRILLSGQIDQGTLIQAINGGGIFRFVAKPCPHEALVNAINEAFAQARAFEDVRALVCRTRRQAAIIASLQSGRPEVVADAAARGEFDLPPAEPVALAAAVRVALAEA